MFDRSNSGPEVWVLRELAVCCLLLAAGLAGCVGGDSGIETSSGGTDASPDGLNPWQAGLDESYPTPDVAEHRSRDERRSNVAEPGAAEFAAFDATVRAWMDAHDIPAGQLALMKDGKLRYERGYGYTDHGGTEPANASTMFRLASVTKPVTAALVGLQVEQGLYNWTDPVFCLGDDPAPDCRLPIDPHPVNPVEDERLADVQVRHLIAHACGFGPSHDLYMFGDGALEVADELGVQPPPSAWRTAQYVMGEELAYDPGTTYEYSNVCYLLAGLVAEAATDAELGALYDAYLFEPLEVEGDIEPGRTRPEHHNPREPFYYCEEKDQSVFDPNVSVCEPFGVSSMQTNLAYGGLIATGAAVAAVYEAYPDHVPGFNVSADADPRSGEVDSVWLRAGCPPSMTCRGHTGGMPGTATASGIVEGETATGQFVFLFNKQEPCSGAPVYSCSVYVLQHPMYSLTGTWASAEGAASADQRSAAASWVAS